MKSFIFLPTIFLMCASISAADIISDNYAKLEKIGAVMEKDPKFPQVVSYTLKNGLKLLILEKHFVPTISFTTIFKTGNVDNPSGKTGLAHLFEHMAFKGTKTIGTTDYAKEKNILDEIEKTAKELIDEESKQNPKKLENLKIKLSDLEKKADEFLIREEFWKIYSELGESGMNAMTSADYTGYVISLPSSRLRSWMVIESDRFNNPVLSDFYRERNVVMEEKNG